MYIVDHPHNWIFFLQKNQIISNLPNSPKSYVPNQHQTFALFSFTHKKAPTLKKYKYFRVA